jgi:hypothetical protein
VKKKSKGIMGASHIPYAQRLKMQQADRIAVNRNFSAKVAMFCKCVAIHRVKGAGYKSLVQFSLRYKEVEDEIYGENGDELEYGLDKAKRRMEQMNMPISGELYHIPMPGMSKREQEVYNHSVQSAQIAMIASAISMNDVWGWGATVQERIELETTKVTEEYNKKGFDWLLGEMEKLGFLVVDGEVRAFLDDDNKAVTPKRARMEGYEGA